MKLGDLIREYRETHDLSQRQFADICKLSNGYVSMLERGVNPNTGKPITPTIPQLKKLADGMGTTIAEIIDKVDDMPVDLIFTGNETKSSCSEKAEANDSPSKDNWGMSLNHFIISLQTKHPTAFEAIERACESIEWATRAISNPSDLDLSDDCPFYILSESERHLIAMYRQLDERGRAAVRNTLEHEYASSTGEMSYSSPKEA